MMLRLSPDGRYITYLKGREAQRDYHDLWCMEVSTEKHQLLVDADRLQVTTDTACFHSHSTQLAQL